MKAHILTREHNEYDQHGEYFVAWFHKIPTTAEIKSASNVDDNIAAHILAGGGRRGIENVWWHLREVDSSNTPGQRPAGQKGTHETQESLAASR